MQGGVLSTVRVPGVVLASALLLAAAGCGQGDESVRPTGTAARAPFTTASSVASTGTSSLSSTTGSTQAATTPRTSATPTTSRVEIVTAPVVGVWVQDDVGAVVAYQRLFEFRPDSSYQFLFTSRPTGSASQQVLARETGTYSVRGDRLSMSPTSGAPRTFAWRVDRDPYAGDTRLVLTLPDGSQDIYYRGG